MLTPQEFQEKHARNLKNSAQDIVNGINRVTESPTKLAAAKKTKMLQNLSAAVQDGRWEKGLLRVSLEDWKKQTAEVGVGRIAAGIDAAKAKVEDFASSFLPFVDGVAKGVRSMPDLTLQDNINRAVKQMTETAKYRR